MHFFFIFWKNENVFHLQGPVYLQILENNIIISTHTDNSPGNEIYNIPVYLYKYACIDYFV